MILIKRHSVSIPTSTIVAPSRIDTHLGTITVVLQAFVHIGTICAIAIHRKLVTIETRTVVSTFRIVADLLAVMLVKLTLVYVDT